MKDKFKKRLEVLEANAPKAKDHILYKLGFDDAIDKACEWLKEQSCCGYIEDIDVNKFVEQFKQAMKGGKK